MYNPTIEAIDRKDGVPYASVCFTRDTSETEMYKELVLVAEAVPATPATDQTAFIPGVEAIYDYEERTRPKIEKSYIYVPFSSEADLNQKIANEKKRLEDLLVVAESITLGEVSVVEPIAEPEPTSEQLAASAFFAAKQEWLQKKAALATMIDDVERGKVLRIDPDAEQVAIMTELATWVNTNMKQEYYF